LPEAHHEHLPSVLLKSSYGITRYKVTLWVHAHPVQGNWPETHRYIPLNELAALPMPSPYRKALERLLRTEEFRLE
jgi:A/G-specific adenine glycosylase